MAKRKRDVLTKINDLRVDAIECKPLTVDWTERLGQDMEGWVTTEAVDCETCNARVVRTGPSGDERHCDVDAESECEGNVPGIDGPAMNYFYPVPDLHMANEDAALAIAHLPVVLVTLDGEDGLALTGCGMDLSWEIAEAHMRLGYLPPTHFDLPRMCGRGVSERDRWIIRGYLRSCQVAANWLRGKARDVRGITAWETDRVARREAANARAAS